MTTMPRSARRRDPRAGFSLVELLVTLVVLTMIVGTTVAFFRSQNISFQQGSQKMELLQNARFSVTQVERLLRTLGAGVTGQQPMLVYGNDNVVAFNADYTENDTTDFRWAVNFNPSIDSLSSYAWLVGNATTIPNSSYTYPPLTYRQANGALSGAETKIFWLVSDSATARPDDYLLYERTNSGAAELISRNILQYPSRPFFQFFLARRLAGAGGDTLIVASGGLLPLIRKTPDVTFTAVDSANAIRPDSVRGIRINLRVTNGLTGSDERTRDFSQLIQVPNNGLPSPNVCGRSPFPPTNFVATPDTVVGSGVIELTWQPSPDQSSGEADVWQYVVYRRPDTATVWADPLIMIKRDTSATYTVPIGGHNPGDAFDFALAAQDCTPSLSTLVVVTATAP